MLVKFIMTPNVASVSPETTLQDAARSMGMLDVGTLPVCGEHGQLIGMLTDRDITIRATAQGLDPRTTRVREVMTEDVLFCFEDQDLQDAIRLMEAHRIRRLVVLNAENRLVGILSLGDLAIRASKKDADEVLREVSDPTGIRF